MVFDLFSHPTYDGYMASAYKNYTILWTPAWMSWSIDSKLYRNTSAENALANRPPWRPMTCVGAASARCKRERSYVRELHKRRYRLIFRTNNGTSPGISVPDAHVYIRRLAYTPLPPQSSPGLLARLSAALLPTSGPLFTLRAAAWALAWLCGSYYLRDARASEAADAAAAERHARERQRQLATALASRDQNLEEEDAMQPLFPPGIEVPLQAMRS